MSLIQRLTKDPMMIGVAVRLWTGETIGARNAPIKITLTRPSALKLLIRPTAGQLAQAYVEGEIDIEGDLRSIVSFATSIGRVGRQGKSWFLLRPRHSRASDRKAIRFHYDVSNDFYRLWLDRNMVYSCAYFRTPTDSLDRAQEQKLDHICRKLRLQRDDHLLDIGCGWGALMFRAAEHYGVRCTGITLSKEQYAFVSEQIQERQLASLCTVRLCDYRELLREERFDKIVSVGMFEHVGRRNLRLYFQTIYKHLKEGGLLLNHGISSSWIAGQSLGSSVGDFIDRHVFPGGELIHIAETITELSSCELEVRDVESLRPHYARTLWHWIDRLDHNATTVRQLVGEKAYRIWRIYMAGSAFAFERGWISIYQVLAGKPLSDGTLPYPLTREHMYSRTAAITNRRALVGSGT